MTSSAEWLLANLATDFCYLTTTGRKSGLPRTIEIWFGVDGSRLFMMAGGRETSDWVRNLMANPSVSVRIGEETRVGSAFTVNPESADDALARRLLVEKYQSPQEDLDDWGRRALPVVVSFE